MPPKHPTLDNGERYMRWIDDRERWEERAERRKSKKSPWDVKPDPNDIAAISNPYGAPIPNPANGGAVVGGLARGFAGPNQATRHARRLYIGSLPNGTTEADVEDYFTRMIDENMRDGPPKGDKHVHNVYINHDRHFCFVEFRSVAVTTACERLDGATLPGRGTLKIRRPNDYDPNQVDPSIKIPTLDIGDLDIIENTVQDGPNKIFIGGLPYHLQDEQVKELLAAFGHIKAFHLVKENGSKNSKGYAFVEYKDHSKTAECVAGLNGMEGLGDKPLTVRVAIPRNNEQAARMEQVAANQAGGGSYGASDGHYGPTGGSGAAPVDVNAMLDAAFSGSTGIAAPPNHGGTTVDVNAMLDAAFAGSSMPPVGMPLANAEPATKVLVLLNMVTKEDLVDDEEYSDLYADIKEECEKFGTLNALKIPRVGEAGEMKVILEYATTEDSAKARGMLEGREFGDAVVSASYMSEGNYSSGTF